MLGRQWTMRKGFDVNGERLTAGDLRASLEGVPDDAPPFVCDPGHS